MTSSIRGFTLIELIVVILILGILAATAAPRFVGLQSNARGASIKGARGAVASASMLAHALQAATNTASNLNVTMDGTTISMGFGYPDATANGISAAAQLSDYTFIGAAGAGATATIQVTGANNLPTCQFTYTSATAAVGALIGTTLTGGC